MDSIPLASNALRTAIAEASRGLVDRETLVELIVLAAVAGEHVLVFGPPGTAKSEAIRRVSQATGLRYFEYLLGRFTEPSEIFGAVDLARLKEGKVETQTHDMLPEAEIAFLDELFLGSSAILNTLLGILNERVFRRGHTRVKCPLRICVGASNNAPDDEALAAFADRFLVRLHLNAIAEPRLEDLLRGGWALGAQTEVRVLASVSDIDRLAAAARAVNLEPVLPVLAHAIRLLRRAGLSLSDRRVVKMQRLVAAASVLAGRSVPTQADLWPLVFAVPGATDQALARDTLRSVLAPSESATLAAAAEEASLGPMARARRIAHVARETLASPPAGVDERNRWCIKLESIVREIDASFAPSMLPADISSLRGEIAAILQQHFNPQNAPTSA